MKWLKLLAVIILLSSLFIIGCAQDYKKNEHPICPKCEECTECIEFLPCKDCYQDKPMVTLRMGDFYINELDETETIFYFYAINYGNIEAKDVKVTCTIEDINEKLLKKQTFDIGNVASKSISIEEEIMQLSLIEGIEYLSYCYVSDCLNCIKLDDLIDDFVKIR